MAFAENAQLIGRLPLLESVNSIVWVKNKIFIHIETLYYRNALLKSRTGCTKKKFSTKFSISVNTRIITIYIHLYQEKKLKALNWAIATILGVSLLTGCGNKQSTAGDVHITNVSVDQTVYSKPVVITINGSGLSKGFQLATGACSNATEIAPGSDTQRKFTCVIASTGTITYLFSAGNGDALYSGNWIIATPRVQFNTSVGNVVVELNQKASPITVSNFINYVNAGFYTNTIIHRLQTTPSKFVQGGLTDVNGNAKTALYSAITNESNNLLSNLRGTISMVKQTASDPNSATSQFAFNTADNTTLDYGVAVDPVSKVATTIWGNAVFGTVVSGMNVVDLMQATPTKTGTEVPVTPIIIQSATQIQ